ncbi:MULTISPECIES: hypothetical protein [unclassified Microbacterium]|uniref:hypothetical protein n=1 Tax=unclassified Microbacterium TaxID=2609290 RepID=UPI0012FA699E|nr:hypothetical protein [Microbacterium sp. MAH-37]MVQ41254.1 hypothetical protein [Microbacterium sp. MAH-37]
MTAADAAVLASSSGRTTEHVDDLVEALIAAAVAAGDAVYDPQWDLPLVAAPYNPIHTKIISGEAHFVRSGMDYALALFEAGRTERGERVLNAVLRLQDADPTSATYGVWPYWAEEPLSEMSPPDWNWADFIGELIALVLYRHGRTLTHGTADAARIGLRRAAESIIRRNVDIDYTNVAAKGAFVLLAAGELLADEQLTEHARDHLGRLHARLQEGRTFAEYNSPTYWHVVQQALTKIRQYVGDEQAAAQAAALERLAWEHFLARWHPATGRLSGPMARCYDTDIRLDKGELRPQGVRMILQRVDPAHWTIAGSSDITPAIGRAHDAVVDYRIPDDLLPRLSAAPDGMVVERFSQVHHLDEEFAGVSAADVRERDAVTLPAVGTTWFDGPRTLGTIAHSDTWLQRRPLLGFWAEPGDDPLDLHTPMRSVTAEAIRDGHAFSAGVFGSAQRDGTVLWTFGLACPGGDEHIHLDGIRPGEARATTRLLVRFTITGVEETATVLVDGAPLAAGKSAEGRDVAVRTPAVQLDWTLAAAGFRDQRPPVRVTRALDTVLIDVLWLDADTAEELVFSELGTAFAAGTLRMAAPDATREPAAAEVMTDGDVMRLAHVELALAARTTVGTHRDHALARRGR